jgi:hypothetical protein
VSTVCEYDRDTVAYLAACGIKGSLLGRVERLTTEVADLNEARERAEKNHPARLLGVAQVAIEVALRTNDLAEVHAQLEVALARIKPTEVPA